MKFKYLIRFFEPFSDNCALKLSSMSRLISRLSTVNACCRNLSKLTCLSRLVRETLYFFLLFSFIIPQKKGPGIKGMIRKGRALPAHTATWNGLEPETLANFHLQHLRKV